MIPVAVILLAGVLCLASGNAPRRMRVHEALSQIPQGFTYIGPAPADASLDLRIVLVSKDLDGLIDSLYLVSDPHSPRYGQHLTKEEVRRQLIPSSIRHDQQLM